MECVYRTLDWQHTQLEIRMSLEVFFYKQEISSTPEVEAFLVDVHADGIPVSKQRVRPEANWFGFAANIGTEIQMSVTPVIDGKESDVCITRTLTVPSELAPVPGCVLGRLGIEKKHVLCGA